MFSKESQFINIIKQDKQLKINYKKIKNNQIISANQASFLLQDNFLSKDIIFKLDALKEEVFQTYTSSIIINLNERIIRAKNSYNKNDTYCVKLNEEYNLLMKKDSLFEFEHYYKKIGFDYTFSPFHILNLHNEQNPKPNSLSVLIVNYHAYILIVNYKNDIVFYKIVKISSFDDIKTSSFYENEQVGQKLYDEIYYFELNNLIKEAVREYYSKKNVSFIDQITILYNQKQLDNSQIKNFEDELLMEINYHSISITESLYELSHSSSNKSYSKVKVKKKSFFKAFVSVALFTIIMALAYISYDRYKEANMNKELIKQAHSLNEELILPNHIIKNTEIKKVLLRHFDIIPYNMVLKKLSLDEMNSFILIDVLDNTTYSKLMQNRFLKYYKRSSIEYSNTDAIVKQAIIQNKGKKFSKNSTLLTLPKYIQDEFLLEKRVTNQIKNIFPEDTKIEYLNTFSSNIISYNYSLSLTISQPIELFNLIDNLNEEVYSINISYPLKLNVNEEDEIEVNFLLQFHQNKKAK